MHQEGSTPDRDGAGNEDESPSFVENFLQRHAVDARQGERMRIFYEVRPMFMTVQVLSVEA